MPSFDRTSAAQTAANLDDYVFDPNHPMHADKRASWAKANNYTLSHKHSICLYDLAGQRHSPCYCYGGIIDHCEAWLRAGKLAAITSQVYTSGLSPNELVRLRALCERLGLCVSTFEDQNWYNSPGGVLLILIERTELNSEVGYGN
jgi:hypothetical protein